MQHDLEANKANRECLSALVDGELDGSAFAATCERWRNDADSRSAWHAYQLIGDALRSDDLVADPLHDASFIDALRARLALEPVMLAPQPIHRQVDDAQPRSSPALTAPRGRRSWFVPVAAAAGVAAVAGALTLTRAPLVSPDATGVSVARSASPSPVLATAQPAGPSGSTASAVVGSELQTMVATGQFIRDARLDRYLAAHKQFAGSSALGVPSAYLRNATAETAGR